MKKIISAVLAATMVFAFASCGTQTNTGKDDQTSQASQAAQAQPTIDKIKQAGKLTMLTNAAFPPFEYMAEDKVVGVDVDIAQEIANEIGVELEVTNMDFDLIVDYVKAGKGDIGAAGITIDETRKKQVNFSVEYITSTQYVIVPAGTDTATFDLNGKVIGVQQGTTGDINYASVTDVFNAKDVKRYKSALDATNDMLVGRVDCVLIDELPAKKITEKNDGKVICYDPKYEKESYAIAVSKESTDLLEVINKVLNKLVAEGKINEFVISHS